MNGGQDYDIKIANRSVQICGNDNNRSKFDLGGN
jgi:hypothetical protein